jgi:hypothetical protein
MIDGVKEAALSERVEPNAAARRMGGGASAFRFRPSESPFVGNAAISPQPRSISGLIVHHLGLTVQLVGLKGLMMTSRIDTTAVLGVDAIAKSILVLRHQNILLDRDLAALYGVTTKRLNERSSETLRDFRSTSCFS